MFVFGCDASDAVGGNGAGDKLMDGLCFGVWFGEHGEQLICRGYSGFLRLFPNVDQLAIGVLRV